MHWQSSVQFRLKRHAMKTEGRREVQLLQVNVRPDAPGALPQRNSPNWTVDEPQSPFCFEMRKILSSLPKFEPRSVQAVAFINIRSAL
jgi:hypothetical protein